MVTATVAGWMVNPDTTVPESRAPMMVGFSMVIINVLLLAIVLVALLVVERGMHSTIHDVTEIFEFRWK